LAFHAPQIPPEFSAEGLHPLTTPLPCRPSLRPPVGEKI
jgi:hypothetical protein